MKKVIFKGRECEVCYKQDAYGKALIVTPADSIGIIRYQHSMMRSNPHPLFLPFYVREVDGLMSLIYRVGSMVPLQEYIKDRKIKGADLLYIAEDIVKCILEAKNYLLYENGFVLELDYLFIQPEEKRIAMLYLPFKTTSKVNEEFKNLLLRLLKQVRFEDKKEAVRYRGAFLETLKNDSFSLFAFKGMIKGIKESEQGGKSGREKRTAKPFRLTSPEKLTSSVAENGKGRKGKKARFTAVLKEMITNKNGQKENSEGDEWREVLDSLISQKKGVLRSLEKEKQG